MVGISCCKDVVKGHVMRIRLGMVQLRPRTTEMHYYTSLHGLVQVKYLNG